MNAKRKQSSFFDSTLRPLLVGVGIGLLICFGLLMLEAMLVERVDVPNSAIFPLAVTAAGVGAFVAGFTAARMAKQRGLLRGALCGLTLFLLILLAGFTRFAGVNGAQTAIKLAALVIAGSIGGILGINRRKK